MRFVSTDLKRAFTEPGFFLALLVSLLCVGISVAVTLQGTVTDGYALFTKSHSLILPFIAPMICALPYTTMTMLEADTGFDRLMKLRCRHKSWLLRRFLVNALVSGVTAVLPGLVLLLVTGGMDTTAFTLEIYQVLELNFAFGVAFGSASYGLCFVNTQRYIPLLAPQVLYLFAIYACPIVGLSHYLPPLAYAPWILPSVYAVENMAALLLTLTGLGLCLTLFGKARKAVGL